jgi:hypothetical protein
VKDRYLPRLHDTTQRRHGVRVGDVVPLNLSSRTSVFLVIVGVRVHCPGCIPARLRTARLLCPLVARCAYACLVSPSKRTACLAACLDCQVMGRDRIQPQRMPLTTRMWLLDVDMHSGPV